MSNTIEAAATQYATLQLAPKSKYYSNYTGRRVKITSVALGVITVDLGTNKKEVKFGPTEYIDLSADALLEREKKALEAVADGADVYDYGIAWDLRQIEQKMPELLVIGMAKKAPRNGAHRQPYFGVQATEEGIKFLTKFYFTGR